MLRDTARAHEAEELQMCQMNLQSGLAQVNAVRGGGSQSPSKAFKKTADKDKRGKSCCRCGRVGHFRDEARKHIAGGAHNPREVLRAVHPFSFRKRECSHSCFYICKIHNLIIW